MVMQLHCPGEGVSRRVQGRIPPVGDGQAPAVVMMSAASPLTPQLRWLAAAAAWAQRGNPQRPPQDSLDRLEAGFEQQKRILLWPADRRGSSRKHGQGLGAESGAATGPIPVGA